MLRGKEAAPAMTRPPRPKRPKRPISAGAALLQVLWQSPLFALPFALFFGVMNGASRDAFVGSYVVSVYFAGSIGLAIWALENLVRPAWKSRDVESSVEGVLWRVGSYAVASLVGAFVAALAVHLTVIPGFLGSARNVIMIGMFTLLFAALFAGLATAMVFYRVALQKVRAEQELHLARRI